MSAPLWKIRYRLDDWATTDVVVSGDDQAAAERKAIRKARRSFPHAPLTFVAAWKFSPPSRWYERSRAGGEARNALGALCCQAWLAAAPWLVEWMLTHRWTFVLAFAVVFTLGFFTVLRLLDLCRRWLSGSTGKEDAA